MFALVVHALMNRIASSMLKAFSFLISGLKVVVK